MKEPGFYKKYEDGYWVYAPNFVCSKNYTLEKDGNRESTDGWEWFDEAPNEYLIWKNNLTNEASP